MTGNTLRVETDKPFYLPGDTLNGVVHLEIEKTVKIRSLELWFQGREKVTIPAGKSAYVSTNEMSNVHLRFLENQILVAGEMKFPFQFQIPPNALPSFVGRYTGVTWKLYAKLDLPWAGDLDTTVFLRVWTPSNAASGPFEISNPEPRPKASLRIISNILQPGERVKGQLTLLDLGNLRSVRVELLETEQARAAGMWARSQVTNNQVAGPGLWLKREQLVVGAPVEFDLLVPPGAATSYRGVWSTVYWNVRATLDLPLSGDVHLYAPFLVTLRQPTVSQPAVAIQEKVPVMIGAGGESQTTAAVPEQGPALPIAETASPASSETSYVASEEDPRSLILKLLGDGGSKDLLTISSELQQSNTAYIDLNTVMKMCEELVAQGKLKRSGTGEYFAEYSLLQPS